MTNPTDRKALVAEVETLLDDVFVGTLRAIKTKLDVGKLSANDITAISRFLSDNGINLETFKDTEEREVDELAETLAEIDAEISDDVVPFAPSPMLRR